VKNTMLLPAASDLWVEAVRARSPYAGLAAVQACSAPTSAAHGTTVSGAGFTAIRLAAVDTQDVPGSPPREAPV
jgi:homoserine kinase